MRVLVTGGAGYIGSHACKRLHQNGHEPIVLDNLSHGHRWAVKWGPFVQGDIADKNVVLKTLADFNIEAIMHFAAFCYVGESVRDPLKYYRNNVLGSLSLIEAAIEKKVSNFVLSSTCAVYGTPDQVPIVETESRKPINPYGESKLFVEQMLETLGNAGKLRTVALRYFNAAGADPDGELGELHSPETHIIPLAIAAALGKIPQLEVFGSDYPTPDGTCIRDYVHVQDIADAHVRALEHLKAKKGSPFEAFNLGVGSGFSVKEVISSVESVSGKNLPIVQAARRPGDPARLVANASKIESALGWRPKFTSLDEIVGSAFRWHNAQKSSQSPATKHRPEAPAV